MRCKCGSSIQPRSYLRHLKTKKHLSKYPSDPTLERYYLLRERFRAFPQKEHINDIYNHLTGHDGEDKNEHGDTMIEAVWNVQPYDFLEPESKHDIIGNNHIARPRLT